MPRNPAQRERLSSWATGERVYHLPPRTALAAVRDLNSTDPAPFDDVRLTLAAMGLPPLADDDDLEALR